MGNTVNIFPTSFQHGFLTRDYIKDYIRRAYMTVLRLCDGLQYSWAKAMGMISYMGVSQNSGYLIGGGVPVIRTHILGSHYFGKLAYGASSLG